MHSEHPHPLIASFTWPLNCFIYKLASSIIVFAHALHHPHFLKLWAFLAPCLHMCWLFPLLAVIDTGMITNDSHALSASRENITGLQKHMTKEMQLALLCFF